MTPNGVDSSLWTRYLQASRLADELFTAGQRCPQNPTGGIRCHCRLGPGHKELCKAVLEAGKLAREIGGSVWQVVAKIE